MWERITRLGAITLIAFMFWIYAEGATRTEHEVTLTIVLVPPEGQPLVIDPSLHSLNLTVRCARSQLQQVNKLKETPIRIQVTEGDKPQRTFLIKDLLVAHEQIARLGISIERVEPPFVSTVIERLETRRLPIELVMPADLELAGPPVFNTDTVEVRLPASGAVELKEVVLQVRLDAVALAGVVPGVPTDRELDVTLPAFTAGWPNVVSHPKRVKVNFTVKKKEDELVINLVPVLLNIAPDLAKQYDVDVDMDNLVLRDVKVKGPSDIIARIKAGTQKIEALLRLTPEDLEKKIPSKLPELRLPAGVTVESTLPLIKLTVTKRATTG